jgi:hypothetical protein
VEWLGEGQNGGEKESAAELLKKRATALCERRIVRERLSNCRQAPGTDAVHAEATQWKKSRI